LDYSIKQTAPVKDESTVLSLWKGNLPDCSAERYRAIYSDNTYGLSWAWLASTDKGEVIGTTGLCRRKFVVNGGTASAGVAIDFAVLKEHRGFGPALKLQRQVTTCLKEGGLDFIYAYPNQQAWSVIKRAGYKSIGMMTRWVKVLRSHYKLKDVLKSETISRIVSPIVDIVVTKTLRERLRGRPKDVRTEVNNAFDERFDVLWEKVQKQFSIIGERSTAFLNWRYGRFLKGSCRIFCLSDSSGENLQGYIVYSIRDRLCHIDDLLFLNSIDTLLAEFIATMRREKVFAISLSYFGSSAVSGKIEEWGFVRRESGRSIMTFADDGSQYAPALLNKENWHLLDGDDI